MHKLKVLLTPLLNDDFCWGALFQEKIPKFVSKGHKKSKIDGTIDFVNGNKMFLSDSIYNHQPKEGDVILFPHYLMHTAYPFKSNGERRSFSFNLEIDKKIANVFSK